MLTRLDDYPVHQTPEPVAHPATTDRNFYDRYFFNGATRDGSVFFGLALGLYPNRRVMDASFSVVRDGVQHVVHASRLMPAERTQTRVGPISVEVEEPLRRLRVRVGKNPHGIQADLLFVARSAPIEEPRFTQRVDARVTMDLTRMTQLGGWEGTLEVAGAVLEMSTGMTFGARDRSWGVRPLGEPEAGPPDREAQFYWLWAPVMLEDVGAHFATAEDARGDPWHLSAFTVPLDEGAAAAPTPAVSVSHAVRWKPGTRHAAGATLTFTPAQGDPLVVELTPVLTFQMLGLGYLSPEWGHGMWKGARVIDGARWNLGQLNPLDVRHLHVQQLCRARAGDRQGMAVLEQLVVGPHAPSGFRSTLDPA
jgi:hypothetical protein